MSDLISKELFDQIKWERDTAIGQLKELGYGLGEKIRTDKDMISRQAAIDVAKEELDSGTFYDIPSKIESLPSAQPTVLNAKKLCEFGDSESNFCALHRPSAQPEIIRCKDCLMHGVCRFEQGLGLDGYCSQAERRTDE